MRWLALFALTIAPFAVHPAPYYLIDLEGAAFEEDALIDGHKRFAVILVGGAQPPAIRRDAQTGSNVLALGAGPTPPGQAADRADIRIYSGITYGRTWFTILDVLIPHGTPRPQDWQVLLQCVQHGSDRSPPISLDLEPDGRLSLIARSDADTYRSLWSAPLAQGRWTRLVLGLRMGADGRARLWVDGRAVADIRQTLGWRQGRGACTLKAGIYRGASSRPFSLRLDNMRLGDTYDDVAGDPG